MADTGWLDSEGKLKPLDQLEAGLRTQMEDHFQEWKVYKQNLAKAKGEAERAQVTADYEANVGKRSKQSAQQLAGMSQQDIMTLSTKGTPAGQDVLRLIKKADEYERTGANPEFFVRDNITNIARMNLIGANPITIARNAVGGIVSLAYHPIEALLASGLEKPTGWYYEARGMDQKKLEKRYGRESLELFRGYSRALPAALINMRAALQEGQRYSAQGLEENLLARKEGKASVGLFGRLADRLFSPLTATDAFFRTVTQGGELFRQSYRQMRTEGMSDADIDAQMVKLLQGSRQQYVDRFSEKAASDLAKGVQEEVNYRAFTQSLDAPGRALQWFQKTPVIGSFIMPFVTTPYNAAKFDLERSAVGMSKDLYDLAMLKNVDAAPTSGEMADRLSRGLIGSAMFAGLTWGTLSGALDVNGSLPDAQDERDAWEREGRRPYSVKIGNRYVSFQDIPGLNATLTQAAIVKDVVNTYGAEDRRYPTAVVRGILEATRALAFQPMAGGLLEAAQATADPTRQGNWMNSLVRPALPFGGAVGAYTRAKDPWQREAPANPVEQGYQTYRPDLLPVRRDAFGRRIENYNAGLAGFNPIRTNAATGFRAPKRYLGSRSAAQDVEIGRSARKVQAWENNPSLPMPSNRDWANAARAEAPDELTDIYRSNERERLATQTARRERSSAATNPLDELLTAPPRRY